MGDFISYQASASDKNGNVAQSSNVVSLATPAPGDDGGLSGGAIAGIVIGSVALAALLVGGAYYVVKRKR